MTKAQLEVALAEFGKELQERRFKAVTEALATKGGVSEMLQSELENAFYEARNALHEIEVEEYRAEQTAKLLEESSFTVVNSHDADLESP